MLLRHREPCHIPSSLALPSRALCSPVGASPAGMRARIIIRMLLYHGISPWSTEASVAQCLVKRCSSRHPGAKPPAAPERLPLAPPLEAGVRARPVTKPKRARASVRSTLPSGYAALLPLQHHCSIATTVALQHEYYSSTYDIIPLKNDNFPLRNDVFSIEKISFQ